MMTADRAAGPMHHSRIWLLLVLIAPVLAAADDAPWWKQEKIRFFWGHPRAGVGRPEVIENLARAGFTVYVTARTFRTDEDDVSGFDADEARMVREHGMRYFGGIYGSYLRERSAKMDAPHAVAATGDAFHGYGRWANVPLPCPLHEPLYTAHLLEATRRAAATGLVDGVLLDWEPYGRPEVSGVCYCADCFAHFRERRAAPAEAAGIKGDAARRWLEEHGLVDAYAQEHGRRRVAMFRRIRDRTHEVKDDFVFSGYHVHDWQMREGLHSPRVPFFVVDMRHYFEDHTRPWWQSYHAHEHKLGYMHVAGSYNITFFGLQPETDVSAAQWMYDAAIHTDGAWLWFEEEPGREMWRSFWSADRRIRATEQKVGDFLLHGRPDIHFATAIEWTGDPRLADRIIQRTLHLDDRHLVQVNNVDTDRPVQVRLRFGRLPADSRWVVQDPIGELTYTREGNQAFWSGHQLADGILVSLERRSELFLRLTPASAARQPGPHATISGRMATPMPGQSQAAPGPAADATGEPRDLVHTRTQDMGYAGGRNGWSLANAIWSAHSDGAGARLLRQLKGHLWSPAWSPDGRHVAFCHYANGRGQIYVMRADGSQALNVSDNVYCDRAAVWSPDSGMLAFVSDRDGRWDVCVMNADGTDQRPLTHDAGCNQAPTWSPDGRALAFESDRGGDVDICIMDADGANQRPIAQLPGDQREPAWSPDGSELAFVGLGWVYPDLSIFTMATGRIRHVAEGTTYVGSPRWSPDGSRIAGVYRRHDYGASQHISGIFAVSPHGYANLGNAPDEHTLVAGGVTSPHHGGRRDPAFIPTWYAHGSASPRWTVDVFSGLSWSPDGKALAFSANIADDGYFHVYTVAAEGGAPRMLADTASAWPQAVDWAPQ